MMLNVPEALFLALMYFIFAQAVIRASGARGSLLDSHCTGEENRWQA